MSTRTIKIGNDAEFFSRGRQLARLADKGLELPEESIISFEDPADLLKLLTSARLALFRTIKEQPGSITDISARLRRDRQAVQRDVNELAKVGLLKVEPRILSGRGKVNQVSVTAQQFKLEASLA